MSDQIIPSTPLAPSSPHSSPPRQICAADAPFDDPHADVIIRSSDEIDFHVHKLILSLASPFFKSMFSLPQPPPITCPGSSCEQTNTTPIIPVTEGSSTLSTLLRSCYTRDWQEVQMDLNDVWRILLAAEKYEMESLKGLSMGPLMLTVDEDPLGVYAVACRFGSPEMAAYAAKASLKSSTFACRSPWLSTISGLQYHDLLQYRHECTLAAITVLSDTRWFSSCPDLLYERALGMGLCLTCYCPVGTHARWFAPKFVNEYLAAVALALKDSPCGETVRNLDVPMPTDTECERCNGRQWLKSIPGTAKLVQVLATEVDKAVSLVPPSKI